MSIFQSKVLSVCAWFFGLIFILTGLGILLNGDGLFASLIILVGSILLLPPIKRLILERKPSLSRGKITVVGSLLILIGCFFISSNEVAGQSNVENEKPFADAADNESTTIDSSLNERTVEESGYGDEYANVNDEIASMQDDGYDDEYGSQEYEETKPIENKRSKRSKLPNPFLDFNASIRTVDNTPIISVISKNKEILDIYDIVINDGISCGIYSINGDISGTVKFGEKFDLFIVGCSQDQIVEVKIITEKGYYTFDHFY